MTIDLSFRAPKARTLPTRTACARASLEDKPSGSVPGALESHVRASLAMALLRAKRRSEAVKHLESLASRGDDTHREWARERLEFLRRQPTAP